MKTSQPAVEVRYMSLIGYLPSKSNPRSITCYAIQVNITIPMATVFGRIAPFHCIRVEWSLLKARQTETGRESHPSQHAMQCNWKLSKAQITWATLHTTDRQSNAALKGFQSNREGGKDRRTSCHQLLSTKSPFWPLLLNNPPTSDFMNESSTMRGTLVPYQQQSKIVVTTGGGGRWIWGWQCVICLWIKYFCLFTTLVRATIRQGTL